MRVNQLCLRGSWSGLWCHARYFLLLLLLLGEGSAIAVASAMRDLPPPAPLLLSHFAAAVVVGPLLLLNAVAYLASCRVCVYRNGEDIRVRVVDWSRNGSRKALIVDVPIACVESVSDERFNGTIPGILIRLNDGREIKIRYRELRRGGEGAHALIEYIQTVATQRAQRVQPRRPDDVVWSSQDPY
ncbi:MAG: hypothetical protein AB7K09_18065 [Planctomycetota bacterium]